jgi:O-antigen ligase
VELLLARFQVWSSYWGLIREHPITGAGLGLRSVAESYGARYGLSLYFTDPHSHNVVLQTYLEQTALGVVGLGIVIYAAGNAALHLPSLLAIPDHVRDAAAVALASAAAAAALFVHNQFDINLNTNLTAALFLGLIALIVRGAQLAAAGAQEPPLRVTISASRAAAALALTLLAVTLLGLIPPPLSPHIYLR